MKFAGNTLPINWNGRLKFVLGKIKNQLLKMYSTLQTIIPKTEMVLVKSNTIQKSILNNLFIKIRLYNQINHSRTPLKRIMKIHRK